MQDTLHVRVDTRQGQAVVSPVCHRRCGTYDAREDLKTSQHLAIRDDCTRRSVEGPKDGVHAARMALGGVPEDASRRSLRPRR